MRIGSVGIGTGSKIPMGMLALAVFLAPWVGSGVAVSQERVGGMIAPNNTTRMYLNLPVTGTDATAHTFTFRIDDSSFLEYVATGDGAGGVLAGVLTFGSGTFTFTPIRGLSNDEYGVLVDGDDMYTGGLGQRQWIFGVNGDRILAETTWGGGDEAGFKLSVNNYAPNIVPTPANDGLLIDGASSDAADLIATEWAVIKGSTVVDGDYFIVQDSADTTDNALQTAKGSAVVNNDVFQVTSVSSATIVHQGLEGASNWNFRGINVVVTNRSTGNLANMDNTITASGKTSSTTDQLVGLRVVAENFGTVGTVLGGIDILLKDEGVGAAQSYGLLIRDEENSGVAAIDTAIEVTTANSGSFLIGLDFSGAVIDTFDIVLENGEAIDNSTDGQFKFTANTDTTVVITVADTTDANTPLTIQSAGTGDLTLQSTAGRVIVNANEAVVNQIYLNAQGVVANHGIVATTTNSGILLDANGANGAIDINAAAQATITSADWAISATGTMTNITGIENDGLLNQDAAVDIDLPVGSQFLINNDTGAGDAGVVAMLLELTNDGTEADGGGGFHIDDNRTGTEADVAGEAAFQVDSTAAFGASFLDGDVKFAEEADIVIEETGGADTVTFVAASQTGSGTATIPDISGGASDFVMTTDTGTVTGTMIVDNTGSIDVSSGWIDCNTGLTLDASSDADTKPDWTDLGSENWAIGWDVFGGGVDTNYICRKLVVPPDYVSGGTFAMTWTQSAATGANTEDIDLEVTVQASGSAADTSYTANAPTSLSNTVNNQIVSFDRSGGIAAGNILFVRMAQVNAAADDTAYFMGGEWTYTKEQ